MKAKESNLMRARVESERISTLNRQRLLLEDISRSIAVFQELEDPVIFQAFVSVFASFVFFNLKLYENDH